MLSRRNKNNNEWWIFSVLRYSSSITNTFFLPAFCPHHLFFLPAFCPHHLFFCPLFARGSRQINNTNKKIRADLPAGKKKRFPQYVPMIALNAIAWSRVCIPRYVIVCSYSTYDRANPIRKSGFVYNPRTLTINRKRRRRQYVAIL